MVEWSILAVVVLGIAGVFGYYAQRVHSQAERAAVLTTLGALRTALVVQHLQQVASGEAQVAQIGANPFEVLGQYPSNYAGLVQGRDVGAVAPGQWVVDAQCGCIGYKPLYRDWLESDDQLEALWFQRRNGGTVAILVALDRYVWQGQLIN